MINREAYDKAREERIFEIMQEHCINREKAEEIFMHLVNDQKFLQYYMEFKKLSTV